MKTFLTYVLLIIGFLIGSMFLEDALLKAMYTEIPGEFNGYYTPTNGRFRIENANAKACRINGYISLDLLNTTGTFIDQCYMKIDLFNAQDLLAHTEYIEIKGMQPEDKKTLNLKFKANNIEKLTISMVENPPDKTNIINILGWEIDLTNVFGLGIDLSNVTIFGTKLTDIFTWSNIKVTGYRFGTWFIELAESIPLWGYGMGWLFVVGLL